MASKQITTDGSGKDGAMAYWEPASMRQQDLFDALKAIGVESLMPKRSVLSVALHDAFGTFLDRAKIKKRGYPIKMYPLSAEVTGFDARQIHPGKQDVDPVFVASVVLDDNGQVRIPKHNSAILPQLDNHLAKVEAAIEGFFQTRLHFFPTETVSACIAKVISSLGGIRIRRTGGLYFVPGKNLENFEKFCLAAKGPEVVAVRFPLVPTENSYASVLRSVKDIAKERMKAVEESLATLGQSKMRSNGKETRLKECQEVLDLLHDYEEILGADLKDSKEIVAKVKAAVDAHAALEWCA